MTLQVTVFNNLPSQATVLEHRHDRRATILVNRLFGRLL
jgi:hypothetical protein